MVHFTFDYIYPIYPPWTLGVWSNPVATSFELQNQHHLIGAFNHFCTFPSHWMIPIQWIRFFFRWYNLNLNLNHQKDIQKEIASWYLVVRGSAQVDWCWLEPPDHAHGLPPGPAPLDALQSVAAATEAVAAALSWAAGGKGSEESAGVTWPKRVILLYFEWSPPWHFKGYHIKAY